MPRPIYRASEFQPDFGIPWIPVLSEERLRQMTVEQLQRYRAARTYVEKRNIENPVGAGWTLPIWPKVMANWKKANFHVVLGGNQCVRGDTQIYDPVTKQKRRIDQIPADHHVWAFDGMRMVIAKATKPFTKGMDRMFRITLSDGNSFVAAPKHVVLCEGGNWLSIFQLRIGTALCRPRSSLELSHEVPSLGVQHWTEKASDFQSDYHYESHLYDGLPHFVSKSDQDDFPSQVYALKHRPVWDSMTHWLWQRASDLSVCTWDVQDNIPSHNRISPTLLPLSSLDGFRQSAVQFVGTEWRASYRPCKSALGLLVDQAISPNHQQFEPEFYHRESTAEFSQSDNKSNYVLASVVSIVEEETDVKWDISVPAFGNYLAHGVIHHNSGKTTLGSRLTVWAAATIPEAETYCFHISEKRSIDDQQRFVYEALPDTIRAIQTKKGVHHSLQYSQKNGFTDSICILPPHPNHFRGGSINFYNYQQYQQNDQIVEGIKAHFVWADEKIPLRLLETLKYRLFTYHGRLLLTYTVIDGWNDTIEKILAKRKTIEKVWCDDPRINGYVPVVEESLSMESTLIYYAHTADNPFTDYKEFLRLNKNADKATFLARAFGVPTKSISGAFPGFSRDVNVVPHADLPFIKNPAYPVTRYMALDPGGSKHWFMGWVAIDAAGTWWVYREWPDSQYEDWALPGNKPGPAQKGTNKGIKDYVELILDLENGEEIADRIIDPRAGAAQRQAANGATNIISDLDDQGMVFNPAPGGSEQDGLKEVEDGIQLIVNLLAYDQSKPRDSVNSPKIYFSDQCQNMIFSMSEYTGKLGSTEACKDPIDILRYLRKAGCDFIDKKADAKARASTGVY